MGFKKAAIPRALKEAVWLKYCGKVFETKCLTVWCPNIINVYDFQAGHRIPESKGGPLTLQNLVPICSRCNLSMGSQYTFDQWCSSFKDSKRPNPETTGPRPPACFSFLSRLLSFFTMPPPSSQAPPPPPQPPRTRTSSSATPEHSSSVPPSKKSKMKALHPYISPTIRV